MEAEEDEAGRRIVSVVHIAMLSAIPLYAAILWLLRGQAGLSGASTRPRFALVLLAVGAAEWGLASVLGRAMLRSAGPGAGAFLRIRRYFLIRFAAAEAMAVFGLFAGFTGGTFRDVALLFSASALALLASTPTRAAYASAFRGDAPWGNGAGRREAIGGRSAHRADPGGGRPSDGGPTARCKVRRGCRRTGGRESKRPKRQV